MKKTVFFVLLLMVMTLGLIGCGGDDSSTEGDDLTVTFNLDGGNIGGNTASVPVPAKKGSTIDNLPPNPIKGTDVFGGWFTAINGAGSQFTTTYVVTSSMTVFAKWTSDNGNGNGNETIAGTWENLVPDPINSSKSKIIITYNNGAFTYEWNIDMGDGNWLDYQKGSVTSSGNNITFTATAFFLSFWGINEWVTEGQDFDDAVNNLLGGNKTYSGTISGTAAGSTISLTMSGTSSSFTKK